MFLRHIKLSFCPTSRVVFILFAYLGSFFSLFWDGTKSQYFELYKQSVIAVRSVDDRLKVGGPSTSNFVPDSRFDGETENRKASEKAFSAEDINTLGFKDLWDGVIEAYASKGLKEKDALIQAQVAKILSADLYDFENKIVKLWTPLYFKTKHYFGSVY